MPVVTEASTVETGDKVMNDVALTLKLTNEEGVIFNVAIEVTDVVGVTSFETLGIVVVVMALV